MHKETLRERTWDALARSGEARFPALHHYTSTSSGGGGTNVL